MILYRCDNCGKETNTTIDKEGHSSVFYLIMYPVKAKADNFMPENLLCQECRDKLRKILKDGFQ